MTIDSVNDPYPGTAAVDTAAAGTAAAAPAGCPVRPPGRPVLTRLYGPDAAADPIAVYSRLRKQCGPVAPVLLEGDVPAWLVLGYLENRRVLDTPSQFSRDSRKWRDWEEGRIPDNHPLIPMLGWRPDCVSQDGEPHRRLRDAVTDSLEAALNRGIRRHITHYANKQIDRFAGSGQADLVAEYAEYLPMLVLTRLFGLGESEGRRLVSSCAQLMKGGADAPAHDAHVQEVLGRLAERKRAEPGADFTTGLLRHPAGLDDGEVLHHLRLVLITAHTTTSNLLARVLELLLTSPARLAALIGGRTNVPAIAEEVMWNNPPLAVCPGRFATADTELGGQRIRAGDLLVLGLTAGNLDPQIRPDDAVSVHGNQSHLAFSSGPHECPGQAIGQSVIETAVDVLLHRLPDLHLTVAPEELSSTASTWEARLAALPVAFTPQHPAPSGGAA